MAVLSGDARYGIEIDSALRAIGHALPAGVCLKWFLSLETIREEEFEKAPSEFLRGGAGCETTTAK